MSRISKRKLIKVLKGEIDEFNPTMTKQQVSNMLENPPTQEQWLKGYLRWRKQQEESDC